MSATSSISSTSAPSNNSSKSSNSNNSSNVLSSAASNIVILENQILDSNDVVAAAGLQQLSNAGTIKLTRDCALQYSNLINSYAASGGNNNASSTSANNNGSPQMNTVNIIPGDASQTSSRVQVLSNVQLVSKGGSQPSTFSYVDASGKNFNVLTSSGKISTNKLISVPITKVKSFNHIGQQQQQSTPQQTQILSSQLQQPQQQKVTVPRSIQLVTRIPNSTISVSNGRVQQLTPTISSSSQPQYSIQQYADSGTSISSSSLDIKASTPVPIVSSTNSTNAGKTTTTGKGKAASTSLKMMQNTPINHGTKSTVGKGMSVSLKSVRNNSKNTMSGINPQYYVKNSTNGTLQQSQPGTTTSIYTTSPAQAVYHNPTPHPPQQQQQQQQPMQFPITTVPSTGKGKGVYKTSKNQLIQIQQQQQQQQQQPHQSPQRSVTPQSPSPIGPPSSYNVPLSSTTSRYQNYNSYSIPSSSAANTTGSSYKTTYSSHLYQTNAAASSTYDSSPLNSDPPTPSHQIQPSMTVTGYTSTTGKGKKYGAPPIANNNDNFTAVTPIKVKGRGRNNSISNYQPPASEPPNAATPYQQRYSASPSRPPGQFQPSPIHQQQQNQQISTTSSSSGAGAGRDDHYIINGQQMTDETSARILQSLSQKSAMAEPQQQQSVKYKPQQQFTFYGSDSVPQSPSSVPAGTFIPGSTNSGSSTNIPGIVYDPSDARFYEEKPDGRRSTSTSEVITYADNIPLREGYPPDYKCYPRIDDEHIGEEVRPAPVDTRNGRYFILQAVMQDHTYFAPPPEQKPPEPPPVAANVASTPAPVPTPPVITPASLHQHMTTKQKSCSPAPITSIAGSVASTIPTQSSSIPTSSAAVPAPLTQMSLSSLAAYTSSVMTGAAAAGSISPAPVTVGTAGQNASLDYIYHQRQSLPQDDDANSVISTGSRNFNATDNDLGEETETAPEGEGEDDSVTRCICDLTHDDGYMICCDKCSAWQHVDCMGIDRMNIPDEYNCEMCQPREVDRNRARMLQLEKRKEQSLFLANNNLQQIQQQQQQQVGDPAVTSTNLINAPVTTSGGGAGTGTGGKGANQYTTGKALAGAKKNKAAGTGSKKKNAVEGGAAAVPKKTSKKTAENALNRLNGKRKELKKPSKKKIKTTEQNAEKMSNMIRTWIDNYERAITNHYSPELRARLQAFGKMQSQNPLLNSDRLIPAASVTNLMQKCTTVPHAGGKILISTGDIEPKTPIIEIRGKYMISSQHKQLQSLFNMAANGKLSNNKNAGPYLFLYQLTNGGMELCVDTRTYGNDARFIRRSCRPNAEILHNVDKGVVHLYIVSTSNIKANTEITIKHDEQLIQRVGGVVILTHTTVTNLCACGLIKECQYSAQLSEGLIPPAVAPTGPAPAPVPGSGMALANIGNTQPIPGIAQTPLTTPMINSSGLPALTPSGKPSKSKKNNGALADGEKKPAKKRNSRSTSSNADSTRLRSISSSGDSTNEMLMYVQQHQQQQQMMGQAPLSPMHQPLPQQQQQPPPQPFQQLISQQMHFMHQQSPTQQQQHQQPPPPQMMPQQLQPQPPVYMYSPTPPPQIVVPRTPPPPVSPVGMGLNNRPGFYTEIKSPINSPPLNLSAGGGPPPLVIPSAKQIPQAPPSPQPTAQPMMSAIPPPLEDKPRHLEMIHQQQQLHQQHIIEDVLKIKIKSPTASPVKRESAPSPTNSSTMTSMLSPPPPPPIPIAQRLLCAETLKNELFHSHYSPTSPSGSSPSAIQKSSPVKVEYHQPLSPVAPAEVKIEPSRVPTPPPPSSPVAVKLEHEIKEEASAIPIDPLPLVKKEEDLKPESPIKEQPVRSVTPDHLTPCEEIKEEPNLCDSLPGSPVKSCTSLVPGQVSSSNSTNSSPIASHHHHGGSGSSSKKKSVSSKDGLATTTTSTPTVKEEKKPSRKLTREERKMEAIVKAFEKMEQSQQRKQELKVQRKEGKRRSVSSSTPDEGTPCSSAKKRSLSSSQQKRKKKKSKSLSQHFGSPNQNRKKKVSKSSSSSKKASRSLCSERPYESKAAELLLTFSQSQSAEQSQSSYFGDDVKPIGGEGSELLNNNNNNAASVSNLPLLSSACMLVEAAVGPLEQVAPSMGSSEQDFKFPQKAKTKKSMSREWLSGQVVDSSTTVPFRRITPDQDSGYMSEDKAHDYRPSVTTPLGVDVSDPNICKKVEEFIAQNSPQPDELGSNSATTITTASAVSTPVEPSQTQQQSNVSESAAVKKRWLRQAISEETDELTQASSSPPPPNGFTTPLKKRRVICQTEETTPQINQQQQPQQQPILSAQKIDFANHPPQQQQHHQQQQPLTMSSVVTNYSDRSMYWSNAVPSPYTEEKHAMDLSRTAPPPPPVVTPLVVQQQQPRIAPYKIVPIAQALTPLHFTDPDPLPLPPVVVAPPAPPAPVMVQQHYHQQQPQQESHDFAPRQPPPSVAMPPYEPLPPPASAVAAMVPASLLPPIVEPAIPQLPPQQQHVRIDVSYPTSSADHHPPLRTIPRSKGSQKYIGSPAKFEPPASPASSITETPEKNCLPASGGSSGVNSDEEVEQRQSVRKEEVIPEEPIVPPMAAQVEEMSVDQEEPVVEESVVVEENVVVQEVEPEPELKEDNEVVHEEVIVTGEVVVEQMEVSSTEETVAEVTVEEVAPPVPCVEEPLVLKPAEVLNGREKSSRKVAPPEEECEKNELEDLQKVIASFHSENIMNLISRNKKAKKGSRDGSGSKRQPKVKAIPVVKDEFNILPLAAAVSLEQSEIVEPVLPEPVKETVEIVVPEPEPEPEPEPVPQPVPPPVIPVEEPAVSILGRSYSHPSWATTAETYREPPTEIRTSLSTLRPDIPPINFNSPSTYQSNAARNLLSSLSVGSEPLSSLTSFRSSSTFLDYPKPTPPPSSTTPSVTPGVTNANAGSSMYQYRPSTEISTLLEKGFSSTRPSSFTTLGTERIPSVTGSATSSSTIVPERTVTSSFLSLSSPKVTENLSTLGSSATAYPKIFTKTASSDPRLNPALTTPEPVAPITPKRKLSINEYRKRKMQSCSSSTTTTPSTGSGCAAAALTTSSSEPSSVTSSSSNSPGSGNVSSSLGSNDVSSSISKELSLELELELEGKEEVGDSVGTTTEPTSSTEEAVQT